MKRGWTKTKNFLNKSVEFREIYASGLQVGDLLDHHLGDRVLEIETTSDGEVVMVFWDFMKKQEYTVTVDGEKVVRIWREYRI